MRSRLYCRRCGNMTTIQRQGHRKRGKGHIKTMWCWRCQRIVQHVENPPRV